VVDDLLLRVVRRVSFEEVNLRVAELERKYEGGIDLLINLLEDEHADEERLSDYAEWSRMIHSLGAYGEGEDFEYYSDETIDLDWSEASKLTPRRLDLLFSLSMLRADSINDLAHKIGRNVKNVYNDLKILEALGFVKLTKQGRRILPELLVQEISLPFG